MPVMQKKVAARQVGGQAPALVSGPALTGFALLRVLTGIAEQTAARPADRLRDTRRGNAMRRVPEQVRLSPVSVEP